MKGDRSMSLLSSGKQLAIALGIYRQARWLSRRLRPRQLRVYRADVAFYRSFVSPGALCFDVGANIGEKSEALLEAGARVVAFEPNPMVLPELRARCEGNPNWTSVAAGLGSAAAVATLLAHEHHGESSFSTEWGGKVVATYQVPVITLDAAIQTFGRPFFCKIDVEGWELEVLNGLSSPLPLVSIEFHLNEAGIQKTLGCLERFEGLGPAFVNVTPAEGAEFLFAEWVPLGAFAAAFPGDLDKRLPGDHYGDIFVRSAVP
jgi:FkbM family methyltransferase